MYTIIVALICVVLALLGYIIFGKRLEILLNAALSRHLEGLPNKLVERILASRNTAKGQAGELIASLKLSADYDRIYPLHGLVDFLGIRLPRDGSPGAIHFIEVKTGRGKLSTAQSALKSLIENNAPVKFKTVTIKTEDIVLGRTTDG